MPTPMEYARAAAAAAQKGDAEAAAYFRQKSTEGYQSEVPKATEDMGGMQRFAAGMGQGATNVGRQIKSLVGMRSPEEAASQQELDADLLSTGAGKAGAFTGEVLATAPVGGLVGAAGKRLGANVLGRVVGGAAGQGAAEGALMSEGDRLRGAAAGAAGGAILPWAGGKLLRGASRGIRPTPQARRLMDSGVDLTPGQMNPNSAFGQLEEAATNVWGVGPMITRAREASLQGWQKAGRRAALPPGVKPTEANGSLESVYQRYEPAYDVAKGFPTSPRIMRTAGSDTPLASFPRVKGAFTRAAEDPNVFADDAARKKVDMWLQNKLTALPGAGKGGQTMDSAELLKLRSEIRSQIRSAMSGKNPDEAAAALLGNAERSITEALESQLPKKATDALRATDKQYSQYKILEDATRRAGDQPQGMTPSQLSAAVKAATPASGYARGEGGPLRKLASAGKAVFDQRTPPTGARLATLGTAVGLGLTAPLVAAPIGGAALLAATTKSGRKLLAGRTAAQKKALATTRALRRKAGRVIKPTAVAAGARAGEEQTNQE